MKTTSASQVLHWMCRTYESTEYWKAEARRFYLGTIKHPVGDADSEKARTLFANHIQTIFTHFTPQENEIERWNKGHTAIESVVVPLPEVPDNVDWDWIADYFLMAASVAWPEFELINTERTEYNNKQQSRLESNIKRLEKYHKDLHEDDATFFNNKKTKKRPTLIDEEKGKSESHTLQIVSLYKNKYFRISD